MWKTATRWVVTLTWVIVGATSCSDDDSRPLAQGDAPDALSDDLQYGCLDWPSQPFSPENLATYAPYLREGDRAVDFTLDDVAGGKVTLSRLLKDKPVVLVTGSYTCPVYESCVEDLNVLAVSLPGDEPGLGGFAHFVHVYVVEAHPQAPDPAPHSGVVSELRYSTLSQPRTYEARLENARVMAPRIHGNQRLLVDDLTPGRVNPVWCTYGSGANSAFLIGQDGTILVAQTWANVDALRAKLIEIAGGD